MIPDSARRRIEELAASTDTGDRAVARRLAGQLPRNNAHSPWSANDVRPRSRWAYVALADLFSQFGNSVHTAGERLKSGHEPVHGSRSGTCVVAWPETGRWWCSSCGRSGDAAGFIMQALGVTYPAAAEWLTTRYGPPTAAGTDLSNRRAPYRKLTPYSANVRHVIVGGGSRA